MCIEAYAAGLLDGEGCITVISGNRNGNYNPKRIVYHQLVVQFAMTDRAPLDLLAGYFEAGNVLEGRIPKNPRWKRAYSWALSGHQAREFLLIVKPYIVCKLEQLELALTYPLGSHTPGSVTDEIYQLRERVKVELQEMKH